MYMERNVFEYEDREEGLANFNENEKKQIENNFRKEKALNNLGYVILEFS